MPPPSQDIPMFSSPGGMANFVQREWPLHTMPGAKTYLGLGSGSATIPPHTNHNPSTDPFDYEQKYAPDEKYREMSPGARVWKTYLDECVKFDSDRVQGWRDGLDMLLVFASLFSSVVSTFITQAYQKLEVDHSKVTSSLLTELLAVVRALADGTSSETVAQTSITADSFSATQLDIWVNALWFTSLGLSLTTALIAVIAKQWIHQHLSVPSGTPQSRARTRHFRFEGWEKWRVPLIIELLPTLMHLSLGLFFLGLVLNLHAVNRFIAFDVAGIAGSAFILYFLSNLLPVFYPDCPYKTPLAAYCYYVFSSTRQHLSGQGNQVCTLYDIEKQAINQTASMLDGSALAWLFNVTTNSSVQSIVVQALSHIPLSSIAVIREKVSVSALFASVQEHFRSDQSFDRFERFQRMALRFKEPHEMFLVLAKTRPDQPSLYPVFHQLDVSLAIEFVKSNLIDGWVDGPVYDAVFWAHLLVKAFSRDIDWLHIDHDEPSPHWCQLLQYAALMHRCSKACLLECSQEPKGFLTLPFTRPEYPPLVIDNPDSNGLHREIGGALTVSMLASFRKLLLHIGFSRFSRCLNDYTDGLPDDIWFLLILLQTPAVQKTSCLHDGAWKQSNLPPSPAKSVSLFSDVLMGVIELAQNPNIHARHKNVGKAALLSMRNVVASDTFGTPESGMTMEDQGTLICALFREFNCSVAHSSDHDFSWFTTNVSQSVVAVAFAAESELVTAYLACVITYQLRSKLSGSLEILYLGLLHRSWLSGIAAGIYSMTDNLVTSDLEDDMPATCSIPIQQAHSNSREDPLHQWTEADTGYLGARYIDGLDVIASESPDVYQRVIRDLRIPNNLAAMCRILLLSDIATQARLWTLARHVALDSGEWDFQIQDLTIFCGSEKSKYLYSTLRFPAISQDQSGQIILPLHELPALLSDFLDDVRRNHFIPRSYPIRR